LEDAGVVSDGGGFRPLRGLHGRRRGGRPRPRRLRGGVPDEGGATRLPGRLRFQQRWPDRRRRPRRVLPALPDGPAVSGGGRLAGIESPRRGGLGGRRALARPPRGGRFLWGVAAGGAPR